MVAMMPTPTIPQPETAVKEPAASIVSRMKARLSIARAWSVGGSGADSRCRGLTEAIERMLPVHLTTVKYFALQRRADLALYFALTTPERWVRVGGRWPESSARPSCPAGARQSLLKAAPQVWRRMRGARPVSCSSDDTHTAAPV